MGCLIPENANCSGQIQACSGYPERKKPNRGGCVPGVPGVPGTRARARTCVFFTRARSLSHARIGMEHPEHPEQFGFLKGKPVPGTRNSKDLPGTAQKGTSWTKSTAHKNENKPTEKTPYGPLLPTSNPACRVTATCAEKKAQGSSLASAHRAGICMACHDLRTVQTFERRVRLLPGVLRRAVRVLPQVVAAANLLDGTIPQAEQCRVHGAGRGAGRRALEENA